MKKILLLCSILLMVGCGGGRWVAVQTSFKFPLIEPKFIQYYDKNYKIGEKRISFTGQEIIKVKPYEHKIPYTYVKNASSHEPIYIEVQDRFTNYKIKNGALNYYSIGEYVVIRSHIYNIIKLFDNYGSQWGLLIDDRGGIFKSALYSYDHNMIFYPESISITPVKINISLREIPISEEVVKINGIPFELIYSGKNDVSLNLTYREYTPDAIARSAFFQAITYQADAKNIRFKDFEIQIHDATNEKITYTVLEDRLESGLIK